MDDLWKRPVKRVRAPFDPQEHANYLSSLYTCEPDDESLQPDLINSENSYIIPFILIDLKSYLSKMIHGKISDDSGVVIEMLKAYDDDDILLVLLTFYNRIFLMSTCLHVNDMI